MSRTFCLVATLALAVSLPLAAFDEMSASAEGRGSISIAGQTLPVVRAEVSLIPGGRFIVSLTGEDRYAFRGQWRDEGGRVVLEITEAQGAAAQGTGELRVRNERFRKIQLNGVNGTFSASFSVTGAYKDFTQGGTTADVIRAPAVPTPSAPVAPKAPGGIVAPAAPGAPVAPKAPVASGAQPPKVTVQGAGAISKGRNDRQTIDAMEVFLEPNGQVNLKSFGPQGESVLTGTWKDGGNTGGQQRFDLTILSAFGSSGAGRGFVLVNRAGHIDRVSVQGAAKNLRGAYSLDFRQK
ncbi:MAG: hypothetical protein KDC27_12865 [Acidobacteria bacterium]|nr:hypothetical protein [Acidobacteriota bacterium]